LTVWYELVRPHKMLEAAFRAIWSQIEEQTATQASRAEFRSRVFL
jgi:hypothetical protein